MKILLLADPNSPHIIKWSKALASQGISILIFGLSEYAGGIYDNEPLIIVKPAGIENKIQQKDEYSLSKLIYLKTLYRLKKTITDFKPDIVHAHYATSYGLLGALSGFHPLILSVWGTDILSFPKKSFLHRSLLSFNLRRADAILATSNYLSGETQKYTNKNIKVLPFGIDTQLFKPLDESTKNKTDSVVIGTIKILEKNYGIDLLIKAFKLVKDANKNFKLNLLLVGSGKDEDEFKSLTAELNLQESITFTGRIPYTQIAKYHNKIDIPVFLSHSESFGVSVLEASACGKAVVVSDAGGFREIVINNQTGLIVRKDSVEQTAAAINRLLIDTELRKKLGENGRKRVEQLYKFEQNLSDMLDIYRSLA